MLELLYMNMYVYIDIFYMCDLQGNLVGFLTTHYKSYRQRMLANKSKTISQRVKFWAVRSCTFTRCWLFYSTGSLVWVAYLHLEPKGFFYSTGSLVWVVYLHLFDSTGSLVGVVDLHLFESSQRSGTQNPRYIAKPWTPGTQNLSKTENFMFTLAPWRVKFVWWRLGKADKTQDVSSWWKFGSKGCVSWRENGSCLFMLII